MVSPQFKAYIENNIALTKSLCIKSQQTIELQNIYLQSIGYSVGLDKTTWKYYVNMSGEYHESDTLMEIVSSDTRETIELRKDILLDHPLTAVDYGPGGIYHKELLDTYPTQQDLILRIFHPVDMATAIEAEDFTILYYNKALIHEREQSLIPRLQKWIYAYTDRWHIYPFAITDPLYPSAMLATLYHAIPTAIMNFRLEACLTNEVSEFHLWAFLGSRYRLDRYRLYLSNKQALFLYRNIEYLRHNVGKEKTMLTMLENITEPVNIQASKFDVTQDDSTLIENRKIRPVYLKSKYAEDRFNIKIKDRYETDHAIGLTKNVGIHDEEDFDRDVADAVKRAQADVINEIPTGLVELNIRPSDNELFINPKQLTLHHWFYLSALNKTKIVAELALGDFGNITVTAKNAALLFMYSLHTLNGGEDTDVIPDILVSNVVPTTYPSTATLYSFMPPGLVKAGYIDSAIENLVQLDNIDTIEALQQLGEDVSTQYHRHYLISRLPNSNRDRSIVWNTIGTLYIDYRCELVEDGYTWEEWLETIDFPAEDFEQEDFLSLIVTILATIVGIDVGNLSLSNLHNAMIEILKLLTSYGIVFVDGTNDKPSMVYDFPWIDPISYEYSHKEEHRIHMGLLGGAVSDALTSAAGMDDGLVRLNMVPTYKHSHGLSPSGLTLQCADTSLNHYNLDCGNWDTGEVTTTVIEDI